MSRRLPTSGVGTPPPGIDEVEISLVSESSDSRQLQLLFEHAADAIVLLDDDRRIADANDATEVLTGHPRDELLGRRLADLMVAPHPVATQVQRFATFVATGSSQGAFVLRRKDGTTRDVEYEATANVRPGGHLSVLRDVTERNQAVRRLTASEAEFRQLADQALDIIARLELQPDATLRLAYLNPAATRLLGHPVEAFHRDPDLVHTTLLDPARAIELAAQDPRDRPTHTRVVRARRRDGASVWLEVDSSVLRTPSRRPTFQVVARDITVHHDTEQALQAALRDQREAADRLRAVNRLKDTLLTNMSHELRTPLTTILGFAETLVEHGEDLGRGEVRVLQDRILSSAQRLGQLLDDLDVVDDMREANCDEVVREPTALAPIVRDIVARCDLGARSVVLDLEEVTVAVDVGRIVRAIENLLDNVSRHTAPTAQVRITLKRYLDGARLVVDDDGPGIPHETRHGMFTAFRQGSAAAAAPSPGTGLGLATVAAVAKCHGGDAHIEDSPLDGTRVVLSLPGRPTQNRHTATLGA